MTKPKRAYHHGDLRTALLESVGAIIREDGIGAVSLREAARRAGVSHSAPAHHFGDKTGLLTAYAARGFGVFGKRMRQAFEGEAHPQEALRAIGREYVRFALDQQEYFEVMFRKEFHDSEDADLREAAHSAFGVLMDAVEGVAEAGLIGDADPMHVAMSSWASVHGLATLWLTGAPAMFTDEGPQSLLEGIFGVEISDG